MLPRVLLLAAVVIWGWTFVATKILLEELGAVEIFALRLAIGVPFLGLVLLARRVPWPFSSSDARPLTLAAAMLTLHFLIQIVGLMSTTATNTSWIISVSPLAVAALSFLLLRERIGRQAVAGIAVATGGILLLISRGRLGDLGWLRSTGDWLILASAFTWALYTVMTRDLARRRDPLAVTFGILLIAGAFTAALFAVSADVASVRALSIRGLAALLYLAIPGLALGQWFWQEGIARLGAARAGLFLYLEPVATVLLAVPLLGESFGPIMALGGGLVFAGVYVGQQDRAAADPAPDPEQDVPCTEDLQSAEGAKAWAETAEQRRPARARFRALIADRLAALPPGSHVLELGSGPGLLAEHILGRCPQIGSYTLFDFSAPMLKMGRARVERFAAARFVLGDFRSPEWTRQVRGSYDAVVSMQAVHEVRHKRHVPRLYEQVRRLLAPGGLFLVCDRTPEDESPRSTALFMTAQEQVESLQQAGFADVQLVMAADALAFCVCRNPAKDR
ncbi:MAG: EamA family transporter [Acidobacteria bacterium]|nr:EamA family transporter [Acidobacteriota bacterium]